MSVKVKDVLDALQQMQKSLECSICLELLKDPHSTKCNHQFCGQCIKQVLEKSSKKSKYKWYCPLCKTPVSKRSLTPNPKLNEIVAAVRSLQGAVQEDTGIPTGSPPSQPFKPSVIANDTGYVGSSIHHPTPQKCINNTKCVKQKVSRKNPFSIYIEDKDNADRALERKEPEVVSNVNIRSTLGPISTQNTTNSAKLKFKSKVPSNTKTTRRTRSSRRRAEKNHPEENMNGKTVSQQLLHMIDTLPFQPVSKGGPMCQAKDKASTEDESQTEKRVAPSDMPYQSAETECQVNNRATGSEQTFQSVSVQLQRTVCLTTVAEADSSIRTSPCDNEVFIENKGSFSPTVIPVSTTADYKGDEGAVSSTKLDCCSLSSVDTMQSVSILTSQDCPEQQCDAVLGDAQGGKQNEGASNSDELVCQGMEQSELMPVESNATKTQEEPFLDYKESQSYNNLPSPQSVQKRMPPENIVSTAKDSARESLDFEGLVSLFHDPSLNEHNHATQNEVDVLKEQPDFSRSERETFSPTKKGRGHWEVSQNENSESDLYERVKQRKRRRPSEMCLQTNRRSEHSKKSMQLKTKTRKRFVESEASLAGDDSLLPGNARKKLKQSEDLSLDETSPLVRNTKESQEDSGQPSDYKEKDEGVHVNGSVLQSVKRDERVRDDSSQGSQSCSSGKTILSSEMIPASVSSSEKSPVAVINPMIVHVDQAAKGVKRGATTETEGSGSQNSKGNHQRKITKHNNYVENSSHEIRKTEESPQIKLISDGDKEKRTNHEPRDQANPCHEQDTITKLTPCQVSSSFQNAFTTVTVTQVEAAKHIGPEGDEKRNIHEGDTDRRGLSQEVFEARHKETQPFDPSEKALMSSCDQDLQFQKEVEEQGPDQVDINHTLTPSREADPEPKDHLTRSFTWHSQGDILTERKGIVDGLNGKLSNEGENVTSQPLSQKAQFPDDTPTQSSLEFLDAMTPCLFGNDSLETTVKKSSWKKSEDQSSPNRTADFRTLDLSSKTERKNDMAVNKDGFDRGVSQDGIEAESRNAKRQQFADMTRCSDAGEEGVTLDTSTEGTQSFDTSQSISVLHDLELPPQEQCQEGNNCSENVQDLDKSTQHSQSKQDASWAEPLPKKPRNIEMLSTSQDVTENPDVSLEQESGPSIDKSRDSDVSPEQGSGPSIDKTRDSDVSPEQGSGPSIDKTRDSDVSPEQGSGPSIDKTRDSECMESDVIPPTPPVKPVVKHVFSNHARSPLRLSRSSIKVQGDDNGRFQSEHLIVKRNRRIKSPRVSKSATSSSTGGSTGSETSENSASLLKNRQSIASDFSKEFEPSQGRDSGTTVNKLETAPCKSPRGVQTHANDKSSSKTLDDPCISQEKTLSQGLYKESQTVVSNSKGRNWEGLVDSPCPDIGKPNSLPRSSNKQKVYGDMEDSFRWSEPEDKSISQVAPAALYDGNIEANYNNVEDVSDDCTEKSGAENLHENDDQDCILVDDGRGDFSHSDDEGGRDSPSTVDEGQDSACTDEEGDSSSDEALLKPVFLPKASGSHENGSCVEDDENDEEEVTSFSQELIPSEDEGEDNDEDGISSCKALDSTGASSATFLSEAAASTQKMEVLRQDVEAMEKEMKELRAYLAKTDEQRKEGENTTVEDDMNSVEEDPRDDPDVLSSLTPPPPLTPKSIPPMRQLSSPLKNASRFLDQEGQSSDEDSDCEEITSSNREEQCELRTNTRNRGDGSIGEKDVNKSCTRKRPLSPSYEDDGLSITAVENRQDKTPSPPRGARAKQKSQEGDEEDLIVIDDRDPANSRTGSLLLVKRRKIVDELVPKKSPVVSLLFTRAGKDSTTSCQSPRSHGLTKGLSPIKKKKSSPFIYSRKRSTEASPISGQDSPGPISRESMSRDTAPRDTVPRDISRGVTRDTVSPQSGSRDIVSSERVSTGSMSRVQGRAPDEALMELKTVANVKKISGKRNNENPGSGITKPLSFVATRLNRKQLVEARALAETYGGKLASEFNNKTTHVVMATDENMQVTRHSYTMKYLLGLALGKWIVSHQWIAACIEAKALVEEADYEVKGDAGLGQTCIPHLARIARSRKEALLFEDFHVLCFGEFSAAVAKDQLSQLLKFCGARVFIDVETLKRIEKDRRKVVVIDKETRNNVDHLNAICRRLNTIPVSLEWVTDSIANYKVQDLKDYVIETEIQ